MKTSVQQSDIDALLESAEIKVETVHGKCTIVTVKLKNGFILVESSACVDPKNYSEAMGKDICMQHIKNKLWELEGYALQKHLGEMPSNILYECDRRACKRCSYPLCKYTRDINHAVNFRSKIYGCFKEEIVRVPEHYIDTLSDKEDEQHDNHN